MKASSQDDGDYGEEAPAEEGLGATLEGDPRSEIARLKASLDESNRKAQEYAALLQRLHADFENHVKRSDIERRDMIKGASRDIIMKLLDVSDTMDLALKVKPSNLGEERILDGFRRVNSNLKSVLAAEGLTEVKTEGCFDHEMHEAVDTLEDPDKPDGMILDVVQRGYALNGRIIRAAKVVVVKNRGDSNG